MVENLAYLESLFRQEKNDLAPARKSFAAPTGDATLNEKLQSLVQNFRALGHLAAKINPLESAAPRKIPAELSLEFYNFNSEHLGELISLPDLQLETPLTVREFFER